MRRRVLVVVVLAGLTAGGTALAQGDQEPYALPEPEVHDGDVLRLASASGCDRDGRLRVRFTPPPGAVFGWLAVDVRRSEAVRMTGVARAASATISLPRGRSAVRVAGETLGGQRVATKRFYRTCREPQRTLAPSSGLPEPVTVGGGED